MPAAYTNLYMEQGASFSSSITIDDVYGDVFNLEGFQAHSQIRKSYYSANPTATFDTSINVGQGTITMELSAAETANIAPGRYVYDTIITSPQITTRVLEGIIEVSPRVTR